MTRGEKQKAIDALKTSAPIMAVTQEEFKDYIQTLNNVMDWLEQESCEDAISRKEVLQTFGELLGVWGRKALMEMSPVTPVRKKGKWCKETDGFSDWYECSECGYGDEGEMEYNSIYDVRTKYCPNCGADMAESEE